jgi:hypothetical protein
MGASHKSRGYILDVDSVLKIKNWLLEKENTIKEINSKFQQLYNVDSNDISYKETKDGKNCIIVRQAALEKNQLLEQDYENNFGLKTKRDFNFFTSKDSTLSYFALTSYNAKKRLNEWLKERIEQAKSKFEDSISKNHIISLFTRFEKTLVDQNIIKIEKDNRSNSVTIYFSDEQYALNLENILNEVYDRKDISIVDLGDFDANISCTLNEKNIKLLINAPKELKKKLFEKPSTTLENNKAEIVGKKEVVNCI